jgi:hypothetical protein
MVIGSSLSSFHIDQSNSKTAKQYNDGDGKVVMQEIAELALDAALFACCWLQA